MRIKDTAQSRVSYGYRRIHMILLREGWKVNHKMVYRLYKLEGMMNDNEAEETQAPCFRLSTHA